MQVKITEINREQVDLKKYQNQVITRRKQRVIGGYDKIAIVSDADADGEHISGLLVGFFVKFLPELKDKIYRFYTPIIGIKKGKKLVRWYYNVDDEIELNPGETAKYYKGFGSWKKEDLREVIKKDGIENMLVKLEIDDEGIIDDWLNDKKADIRKEYIKEKDFDINKA